VITLVQRLLLDVFGRLPRGVRRRVVRTIAPSYTVGAICVIERSDGQVVLIQQRYRGRWGLPGGLLSRREHAADAAVREVREEIGIEVELLGPPTVVVEPHLQRVDVVYRARPLADDGVLEELSPCSPEITAVAWFRLDALPDLQDETATAIAAVGRALGRHE
jgi:8-oxo-dGTP diphosphatase